MRKTKLYNDLTYAVLKLKPKEFHQLSEWMKKAKRGKVIWKNKLLKKVI